MAGTAASIVISAAMLYAQNAEHENGNEPPRRAVNPPPTPTVQGSPPAAAPNVATPAEADMLAANAPVATPGFEFALLPASRPSTGCRSTQSGRPERSACCFPRSPPSADTGRTVEMASERVGDRRDDSELRLARGHRARQRNAGFALANAKRWGMIDVIWRHGLYLGSAPSGRPSWAQRPPTTSTTFISPPTVADTQQGTKSTTSDQKRAATKPSAWQVQDSGLRRRYPGDPLVDLAPASPGQRPLSLRRDRTTWLAMSYPATTIACRAAKPRTDSAGSASAGLRDQFLP